MKVIDVYGQELPGIPTPSLTQAGGGLAYFVPNDGPNKDRIPGVWYLKREPSYVSPTNDYRRVRVVEDRNV